ncbi:iron-containing alcohol dehydrogenase [Cupriavidus necator]|uniref:iron-containing alcohol dehydrogenase n=1 Tax=Cupriavidus necator TaxID=106590 RepID=UPI0039C314C6
MNPFVYHANPARVVFGAGAFARLHIEINRLGCRRALVLSTQNQIDLAHDAARLLGDTAAGVFDQAQMHVPAGIAAQASKAAMETGADCLVATGGGSTIGLAKPSHSPEAETHTIVLPHALAYNRKSTPRAMHILGRALDAEDGPRALFELARDNGAPTALRDIGLRESDIPVAADIALTNPYWNPAPLEREALLGLLQRAYQGEPPI